MSDPTPFGSPSGLVITTRQVMEHGHPILLVTHDADEPVGWQFVNGNGDTDDRANGRGVHAEHVIEREPSVLALADLPLGWVARRVSEDGDWIREQQIVGVDRESAKALRQP